LTIAHVCPSKSLFRTKTILLSFALLTVVVTFTYAQAEVTPPLETAAAPALPDSPGFLAERASSSLDPEPGSAAPPGAQVLAPVGKPLKKVLSHRTITVEPGVTAPPLSVHDKVVLGLGQSFTVFSVVGWAASAGYSQLVNGSPNFGTDSGAFGMRLGATALRATSQNIMGNAFFAPLLHEDPRYYRLGKGHNPIKRIVYAATRTLITRNDDGDMRPNISLLSGNLAGAALTNTYYPTLNQGFEQTAKTFGSSVGGSAVGFIVSEFLYDALDYAHLQRLK
jgi:hypothetical protein